MAGVVLAEGVVEVTADAKGVPRAIAKEIESGEVVTKQAGANVGKQVFGGIIGAWATIGGTQILGDFFKGTITGASDVNETISKSSTIFGVHQASIESFANNAAKNLGLSRSAAMNAAAGFGDMFSQIGFSQDQAAAFSQQVVQMSADLGSFSNLETADVADRISAAFRGEYDSLQAVIPNINAARVESEAMAATGKKTAAELTAQEKATAVLATVQKDGARAMGDFAKTSDGAANSAKIATASLEDQQAKLGGLLLPAWTGFLGFINSSVIPGLSSTIDWMGKNGETMGLLAGVVGGAAVAYWGINSALAIHKAYTIASAAATGGLTVGQWALNAALSANPVGLIVLALAALVAGIVWVATQTTFFQDTWTNVTTAIGIAWQWVLDSVVAPVSDGIGAALTWVSDAITWLGDAWTTGVNAIGTGFTWLHDSVISPVATAIGDAWNWLLNSVIMPVVTGVMIYIGLWAALFTWIYESVISPVMAGIGSLFNWLYTAVISPALTGIGALFDWIGNVIIAPIFGFISSAVTGFGIVVNWLWGSVISPALSAIGGAFMWLWNGAISIVLGTIQNAIRGFGIIMQWLQMSIVQPVMNAVGAAFQWVWASVISPVVSFISGAINNVGTTVRNVFGTLGSFIGNAFTSALGAIKGPINGIIGLVNSAIGAVNKISVTIPDWVPIVGGQTFGVNIPKIPMLARGAAFAPDTFIAGENGPELIVGAGRSRVYPADQTRNMLESKEEKHFHLEQKIYHSDPIIAARQAARESARYMGV